jgi:catechol 2,3-dioxygenase-like lactoylglutathione lyase family enzyme
MPKKTNIKPRRTRAINTTIFILTASIYTSNAGEQNRQPIILNFGQSAGVRARVMDIAFFGREKISLLERVLSGALRCGWNPDFVTIRHMTIQRMAHVGIVVDDLAAATEFFVELGLELQGEGPVEGRWVDRVVGLDGVQADIAMLQTPDGHGRLELNKFHTPSTQGGNRHAPANTPGIRHIAFAVEDIDAVVSGLRARGAELVGELELAERIG